MHLPDDDDHFTIPEDNDFCIALVKAVPALVPLMKEHLENEFGSIESYVFMSDVARWAETNAIEDKESVRQIVSILNENFLNGEGDVPNLIRVGFGESVSLDTPLVPLLTGELKKWHTFDFGLNAKKGDPGASVTKINR